MSEKYLWMNTSPQDRQTIYIYLNEFGKKIYGNIVTNCCYYNPYSEKSVHKGAHCTGLAVKYVGKYDMKNYDMENYLPLFD